MGGIDSSDLSLRPSPACRILLKSPMGDPSLPGSRAAALRPPPDPVTQAAFLARLWRDGGLGRRPRRPRRTQPGRAGRRGRMLAIGSRDPVRWSSARWSSGWSAVFIMLGWIRQHTLRHVRVRPRHLRPGRLAALALPRPVRHGARLEFFGHHVNPILLRSCPSTGSAPVRCSCSSVQVVVQASGAFAMFLLARDRLHDRWLAVALGRGTLLNPTYQWLTWEFFHPDAVAIAPAAVRVLGRAERTLEVVRALRGAGGRRARRTSRSRSR